MTTTLADIRKNIGERLQDPSFQSISAASVDAVINQALSYYKYSRFWFNESLSTITLNVNDPVVPNIPADLLVELPNGGLTIHYSTVYYPLEKRSSEIYDSGNVQAVGLPYIYTYRNQQYEVYFYPNIQYTLLFRYLKDYNPLIENNDHNDFTDFAPQMITYNALSRIYAEYKQDPNMEAYYTARAQDEKINVERRSSGLTGSGTLTLTSYLVS